MHQQQKARILLILSAIVFGTIALFTKNIPISSGELSLYRAILAAFMVAMYLWLSKKPIKFQKIKKDLPLLLLSGASMGINWILLFEAYHYTTVSVATISYYFAPILVTIFCPIFFKEKMTKKKLICFIFSTVGLFLVIGLENLFQPGNDIKGILLGLGAALFYTCVIMLNKTIKRVAGIERTLLQFMAAIIVLTPYVFFSTGFNLHTLEVKGWLFLLIVGFFHTGFTYCMYFSAIKDLPGQETAILSYIDPLVATLLSVVVLSEYISPLQLIGAVIMLSFTIYSHVEVKKA